MAHKYLAICAFLSVLPCLAASFPDYPVGRTSDYANSSEKSGIRIAAIALDNLKQQKKYFKLNLHARGYLPVFVIIENGSSRSSFILKTDRIGYGVQSITGTVQAIPQARSKGAAIATNAVGIGGSLFLFSPTWIGTSLLAARASDEQQNIQRKELRTMTLAPQQSGHGFLYIRVPRGPREKIRLVVPFIESGLDETVDTEVTF